MRFQHCPLTHAVTHKHRCLRRELLDDRHAQRRLAQRARAAGGQHRAGEHSLHAHAHAASRACSEWGDTFRRRTNLRVSFRGIPPRVSSTPEPHTHTRLTNALTRAPPRAQTSTPRASMRRAPHPVATLPTVHHFPTAPQTLPIDLCPSHPCEWPSSHSALHCSWLP